MDHHPDTREELKENPAAFVRRENAFEKHEGEPARRRSDITESELRNWDNYLDKHRDVELDLNRNPNQIDDPAYLSKHPHLKEFLEHHPHTREELRENPKAFMHRERGYERNEDHKHKGDRPAAELKRIESNWRPQQM